jgi:hypothetical protein
LASGDLNVRLAMFGVECRKTHGRNLMRQSLHCGEIPLALTYNPTIGNCELFVAFFFRLSRNDFENVALQLRIVRKKT